LAAALKLFAWPVVVVLAVWGATRRSGRRVLAGALGLPAIALLPVLLIDPDALVENVLRFPLGQGLVTSPAQSPLPGHLISTALPAGRLLTGGLLLAVGLVFDQAIALERLEITGQGSPIHTKRFGELAHATRSDLRQRRQQGELTAMEAGLLKRVIVCLRHKPGSFSQVSAGAKTQFG